MSHRVGIRDEVHELWAPGSSHSLQVVRGATRNSSITCIVDLSYHSYGVLSSNNNFASPSTSECILKIATSAWRVRLLSNLRDENGRRVGVSTCTRFIWFTDHPLTSRAANKVYSKKYVYSYFGGKNHRNFHVVLVVLLLLKNFNVISFPCL